jgi:hypothetical protein
MANKRMFSLSVVDTDWFLDLPLSTQALYFHLNMRADDDGFVDAPNSVVRKIGASKNDFDLLVAKRYVLKFDSGIIVVKHWRMHNTLRKDRYVPTQFQEEFNQLTLKENGAYTDKWQPNGNQMATNGFQNGSTDIDIGLDIDKDIDIVLEKEISKEKNPGGTSPLDTPTNIKHKYGEYGWVKLTDKQYETLCKDFNKDLIDRVITKLDEYMQSNGNKNKYKDCNLVIRKAIRENWFKVNDSEEFTSQSKRTIEWEDALHPKRRTAAGADSPYAKQSVEWEEL